MKLLALDTTSGSTGVAVAIDGEVAATAMVVKAYRHSETLFAEIDAVMEEAGVGRDQLDGIAVTNGPGSFTGLRVGVATAKGLAYGLGLKVAGVSSLKALAWTAFPFDGVVVPMFDARKGQIYAAAFDAKWRPVVEEGAWNPSDLAAALLEVGGRCVFLGSGVGAYEDVFRDKLGGNMEIIDPGMWNVDPAAVARLGDEAFRLGEAVDSAQLVPVYHRLSEAEENRLK